MAHISGVDASEIIDQAHAQTGPHEPKRAKAQRESLIRNRVILERLGCIDEAGMIKLRKGNAPIITKGPYAGEIVTGDHIIPRSVCPELDNALYNLEMMPLTLNQRKSAKIGTRQMDLAKRWNTDGLLSDAGLKAAFGAEGGGDRKIEKGPMVYLPKSLENFAQNPLEASSNCKIDSSKFRSKNTSSAFNSPLFSQTPKHLGHLSMTI